MKQVHSPTTVAQTFCPVKSTTFIINDNSCNPMIHHKPRVPHNYLIVLYNSIERGKPYGVSRSQRVLSPGLLLKKFDYIRDGLEHVVGLTRAQRDVALELLRLWAYYGQVYPKEAHITEDSWTSKATFWRTVKILKELGLVQVVNRYVLRPHAQISNLYRLDRLVLLLAKYLAEHIGHVWDKWLHSWIDMSWPQFWDKLDLYQVKQTDPGGLARSGP